MLNLHYKKSPLLCAAATLLLALIDSTPAVLAAEWSDTWVGYRTSTRYTEPSIAQYVSKNIYSLNHVSHYRYGDNFFSVDFIESDNNDPSNGGGGGAQEVYGVYRHTLDLSAVSGKKLSVGPLKTIGLTRGFDRNAKNDAFFPRVRKTVFGPTLKFDVPGYFNASLLLRQEDNHNGIVGQSVTFDDTFGVSLAWGVPLDALHAKFEGFFEHFAAKGKDGFGVKTAAETLSRAHVMFDVGTLFGKEGTWYFGAGYEYWNNKYGVASVHGNRTHAPVLSLEIHW